MKTSRKTTVAGGVAGLGLLVSAISGAFGEGHSLASLLEPAPLAQIAAGLGALFHGMFARDDDVTSEGTDAPKRG